MADSIEQTGNAETQEQNENAIFDNDTDLVEQSLLQKFTPKEPEEEPEEETEEEEEQEQEEVEEVSETEEDETEEVDEEEEESEEDDSEAELPENMQVAFDKRINRKLKQLEKQYEEKFKDLEQAKVEAEAPTDALSQVKATMSLKSLEKIEDDAEKTIDFVEDNPDGFTLNEGKEGERYMDRQELLSMKRNARAAIKAAKTRRSLITEKTTFDEQVYKAYPKLKDKASEEYVAVESVFNEIPALKEHPKGTAFAIYMLLGEEAAAKPQKKVVKKKPQPKAPKLPEAKPQPKKSAASANKPLDLSDVAANAGDQQSLEAALLSKFSK